MIDTTQPSASPEFAIVSLNAGVAQLVEQLICNQPVASSSLVTSFFIESLSQSRVQASRAFVMGC